MWTTWIVVAGVVLSACGSPSRDAAGDVVEDSAKVAPQRLDGQIRVDDVWKRVAPLVIHEAKMDLFVSCRIVKERAKEAGQEMPLCYGTDKRAPDAVRVIRVEYVPGTSVDAMRFLAGTAEGTHFIVERSGSRFQLLDLAYAARRDGAVRGDEIRVLAMDGASPRSSSPEVLPLVTELEKLYPNARVDNVDVKSIAPPPAPDVPAPPAPVPAAPDAPPTHGDTP